MRKSFIATAGVLLAAGTALAAVPGTAQAAATCASGSFCAYTDANFGGLSVSWTGDDGWWESNIADEDSSWANHGISGPGIKDHVKVYASAWQNGGVTICLAPGQEVGYDANANDRGDSHIWTTGC
ncbi:peptidase inhibitor family I36 protein [Streptomyces cylindrosporus]|uniref:Peptidase inhibitor family I36 protein n=1 Tax=Streptomyces cylindrosporus TaxID=2927583 RepID=A0ABS9YL40_9ACTN|nr:peptidase inhibitor family I36 protein [Streptomyces cylindrosporus]MCI3277992.1 peptidase inhibitor family I36 protein [Streptomyces cylindrosporus]